MPRVVVWFAVLILAAGCGGPSPGGGSTTGESGGGVAAAGDGATSEGDETVAAEGPREPGATIDVDLSAFDLGSVVVPTGEEGESADRADFEYPTLEELKARTDWVDGEVVDAMEVIRQYKATLPPPPSAEEIAGLKNDSPEANEKLSLYYGQLPQSTDEIDYEAEFVLSEPADVKTTNPLVQSSVIEQRLQSLISFGLWGFDREFNPFALADTVAEFKKTEDETIYLVTLRDDLTWSDGEPITAHDVEFSYRTIMDEEVPVPAVRSGTDELLGVKAYGDRTVAYFHPEPRGTNMWNVNFPVIPKHIYSDSVYAGQPAGTPKSELPDSADKTLVTSDRHVELEDAPVTGGPYKVIGREQNQFILLGPHEGWWKHEGKEVRERPNFARVRLRTVLDRNTALLSMKAGEIEYIELTPPQWVNQTEGADFYEKNVKLYGPEWTTYHVGYNVESVYFRDPRVRRAMSYALDYETMLQDLLYGLYDQSAGVFHPDSWASIDPPPALYEQDLDKAEDLLDEAGWDDSDGDGIRDLVVDGRKVPFEFNLIFSTSDPNREKIGTLLKENLDQIGVRVNLQPLEFTVVQERSRNHDFDAQIAGWGTGADPYTSYNLWGSRYVEGGRNYGMYRNEDVDKLFVLGEKAIGREERAPYYAAIHGILWNEQPYTWLYTRSSFIAMNKDLRGITFSPRDPFGYSGGFEAMWKPKNP